MFTAKQGLFFSENVDDIKMPGMKQNMAPIVEIFCVVLIHKKNLDLDETTLFLDLVYLGCKVNVNRTKLSWRSAEKCSNHEFLLEQLKNYRCGKNLTQRRLRGPMMEGHAPNALKDTANWRKKKHRAAVQSFKSLLG